MAAGGTGGHIFPALAVAEELRARWLRQDSDPGACLVEFLGTGRGIESRLIPAAGFVLHTVTGAGLKGIAGWKRLHNLAVLPTSVIETALVLRDFRPSVVVGVGGYIAGPAMLLASLQEIPTLLIEPNAVPGFTNRVLAPLIRCAAVAYEETARYYGPRACLTGQPVRKAFLSVLPKEHTPPFTILVLGGSQGSAALNRCICESLELFAKQRRHLRFIHQTGVRDYSMVAAAYRSAAQSAEVHPFIEDVSGAFARADLVISRAGATAVAELAVAGKASLLVPFPAAADQHQQANAHQLERAGAARVIRQSDLTPTRFIQEIDALLTEPGGLADMERRAKSLARPDATERIADLIEELARGSALT